MQQNRTTYGTIAALSRLEGGDPGGTPSCTSCSSPVQYSRVLKALYHQGVSISKDGVPTASLGNLLQFLTTLTPIFPSIRLEFPMFHLVTAASPPSSLHLWLCLFYMLRTDSFRQQKELPWPSLLKAEQTQFPQPFLVLCVLQLGGLSPDSLRYGGTFLLLRSCKQDKISKCGLASAK